MVQKKRNNISSKYMTYCLCCKKYTNNIASRSVAMTNEILRQKSGCIECLSDKGKVLKQKPDKIGS